MIKYLTIITALLLTACQSIPEAKPTEVLEVSDGDTIELNPTIVTKTINGKQFRMYGYNGQVPGPMIKAPQGATITVHSTNNIDTETTIHWHGLCHDNSQDGVPGLTQTPTAPGQSHTYTVRFPDEGMYWYHPHVREDIQQDMGLYGNLFVTPVDSTAYNPMNYEEVIVLDDLLLNDDGNVAYGTDDPNLALMGRFGNTMLINGEPAKNYKLTVNRGEVVRFYLTNVANTRTFNIRIDGGAMKLVGSDLGRYENDEWADTVTIAPAERYIVEVLFEDDGTYRLTHESPLAEYDLGSVTVTPSTADPSYETEFYALKTNADVVADIDDYRQYFDKPVDKTLVLDIELDSNMMRMHEGMDMVHHDETGIEWEDTMPMMNQMMASEDFQWKLVDKETGKENMEFMWEFTKGDKVKIRIENKEDSGHPMQHPIHFHGQRFLVVTENGVPNENLVWKDTVLVPIGQNVELLFDMSNPGDWMFHCHIAEHLSNGMMGMFRIKQ